MISINRGSDNVPGRVFRESLFGPFAVVDDAVLVLFDLYD
jgi:hypothetical protein